MTKVLIVAYKRKPLYNGPALIRDNSFENIGFARAVNELILQTNEDVILLSHDACPVNDDVFQIMEQTAYSSPNIGIVQAKMMRPDGTIDTTGHQMVRKHKLGSIIAITGRGEGEIDHGQYDDLTELPSCDFAAVFIKRKVIESVGLLDPWFFLGVDDLDYSFRARRKGWRIVFEPRAIVRHARWTDGRPWWSKASVDLYRFYIKNAFWSSLVTVYFWNFLGIFAAVKNSDPRYAKMKLRGLLLR